MERERRKGKGEGNRWGNGADTTASRIAGAAGAMQGDLPGGEGPSRQGALLWQAEFLLL